MGYQGVDLHKGDLNVWGWIALSLGGIFLAIWVGLQPLLNAAERLAMAAEKKRVQTAVEAYRMLAHVSEIPCRHLPRRILPSDGDAPFARFLERPTQYAYRWFEGGYGLHVIQKESKELWPLLAVVALTEDVLSQGGGAAGGVSAGGNWQEQLSAILEAHVQAGNAMGLVNPFSGSNVVMRGFAPDGGTGHAPAILIINVPLYSPRYVARHPKPELAGTIVVGNPDVSGVLVFMVGPEGKPGAVRRVRLSTARFEEPNF